MVFSGLIAIKAGYFATYNLGGPDIKLFMIFYWVHIDN